jgi:hypothetical protein
MSNWSDEETDDPIHADRRNFYKVEQWSKDGQRVIDLFAYVITLAVVKVPWAEALRGLLVPSVKWDGAFLTTLVAILGTTISPYLFIWQSSQEAEEQRIDPDDGAPVKRLDGIKRRKIKADADEDGESENCIKGNSALRFPGKTNRPFAAFTDCIGGRAGENRYGEQTCPDYSKRKDQFGKGSCQRPQRLGSLRGCLDICLAMDMQCGGCRDNDGNRDDV